MDNGASSYRRFLDGEESAFDELLDLYQENLIFFLNRYVHNITVAEDLAADVFLSLILHRHRYNFKTSLKTYLFLVARCRAINYLKHEKQFQKTDLEELAQIRSDEASLEEQILLQEDKRALHLALDRLPEDYRTALHLIYFENMSYEEAGRVMKKNRKQVNNLVYRGKNALRSILGKEGYCS